MAVGEVVKKITIEVLVFSIAGVISITGSYPLIKKFFPPVSNVAIAKETEKHKGSEGHSTEKPKNKDHGAEEKKGEHKEDEAPMDGVNFPLKPVIVNLSDETTRRFAKTTLTLQLTDEKVKEELTKKDPQIYDTLIKILSHYRFDQISSAEGKETMKEEIKNRLNLILKDEPVQAVYLIELIVQ